MTDPDMEAFIRTQAPALLRRARLLTPDRHLAEDLTQEALTKVVVRWRRISKLEDPVAYTHRTLVNTFLSHARKRSFTERPSDVVEYVSGTAATPPADDSLPVDLARALADLPPEHRAVLVLRYFDDLSVTDVATELGRTESWVRQTAHRASQRLRTNPHLASPDAVPVS